MASHTTCLSGGDLGFVVEAKALQGTYGASDIYVPVLRLLIQIDGQHHTDSNPVQQDRDTRWDMQAFGKEFRYLRLYFADKHAWPWYINVAIEQCMSTEEHFAMYTPTHYNKHILLDMAVGQQMQ